MSAKDREDLVYERSRNLPAWAENNPHTYFRAAERYERVNGVAFEEWKVTLPHELSHRQNLALTRDLVDAIAGTGCPSPMPFMIRRRSEAPASNRTSICSSRPGKMMRIPAPPRQHFKRYNPDAPRARWRTERRRLPAQGRHQGASGPHQ